MSRVPIDSIKRGAIGNAAAGNLNDVNAAWYYTYDPDSNTRLRVHGVPYVGMVFCNARPIPNPAPEYLLGYNEPDTTAPNPCKRRVLTPSEVIDFWPQMEASGAKLGSPAPLEPNMFTWVGEFLRGKEGYKPRVDFLTVHWYGNDARKFLAFVDKCWNTFGLPIWVTEFAMVDTPFITKAACIVSPEMELSRRMFMKIAMSGLESREYVHRYSWYGDFLKEAHACYTLWDKDGNLTYLGRIYGGLEEFGV
jgi:Glycosyl hydrolase catalytic core